MPEVNVEINGRRYRMACEEGQQKHLIALAERYNTQVEALKGAVGEIGDTRLTVMAGIMVMDELSELTRRLQTLEAEVSELRRARDNVLADAAREEETIALALGELTTQIQGMTAKLTGRPAAN